MSFFLIAVTLYVSNDTISLSESIDLFFMENLVVFFKIIDQKTDRYDLRFKIWVLLLTMGGQTVYCGVNFV